VKTVLVNPLDEAPRTRRNAAPRLESLEGASIALLDISKPGGRVFLDYLERELKQRYRVARIIREAKPTFTKPAPDDTLEKLIQSGAQAVVEALAD
jgi:hypothetical protein